MEHEEIELKIFATDKFGPIRLRVCAEYQTDLVSVLSRRGMSDSPCGDRTVNDGEVTAICGMDGTSDVISLESASGWSSGDSMSTATVSERSRSSLATNSTSLSGSTCVRTIKSCTERDFSRTSAVRSPRVTLSCHDLDENRLLLPLLESSSGSFLASVSFAPPPSGSSRNCGSGNVSSKVPPAAANASSRLRKAAETVKKNPVLLIFSGI